MGAAFLPLEHARLLGHGQPSGRNQSAQHLRRIREDPRAILELGIFIGGLLVPLAARFLPWLRASRFALFLPPAALVPTAVGVFIFKLIDGLQKAGAIETILLRPSETVETYLYFFILAYFIVYASRIKELEVAEGALPK